MPKPPRVAQAVPVQPAAPPPEAPSAPAPAAPFPSAPSDYIVPQAPLPSAGTAAPYNPMAASDPVSINPFGPMPFQQGPDSIWGNPSATPDMVTKAAAPAANQNPGSTGTASVDLGPAPTVAHLGGHAL